LSGGRSVAGLQITFCTLGINILIRSRFRFFRLICLAVANGYLCFGLAGVHGGSFTCAVVFIWVGKQKLSDSDALFSGGMGMRVGGFGVFWRENWGAM